MPKTSPSIIAPRTRDPRILLLAKTLNVSRADAYLTVCELWELLTAEAEGDIVKGWTPDTVDALLEIDAEGLGQAMVQAGLVGVVSDGLVLPPELRQDRRDEAGGRAAAPGDDLDPKKVRRRGQNAASSYRYRKRKKVTGTKTKPTGKAWRSLGRVAGHEVRVLIGQYGPYAMVIQATLDGKPYRKLTTGDKSWTLEGVTLLDALPGLVDKAKGIHDDNLKVWADPSKRRVMVPSYEALRDDYERLKAQADFEQASASGQGAAGPATADDADASSRHADASATVSNSSADRPPENGHNSKPANDITPSAASAIRHADALSSMSSSKSSSYEEDMGQEAGRHADAPQGEPTTTDTPTGSYEAPEAPKSSGRGDATALEDRRQKWLQNCASALGVTTDDIIDMGKADKLQLRRRLEAVGVDPNTGLPHDQGQAAAVVRLPDRRGRSVLEAAGVTVPDLSADRPAIEQNPADQQQAMRAS